MMSALVYMYQILATISGYETKSMQIHADLHGSTTVHVQYTA
jgi:hypothetical protein